MNTVPVLKPFSIKETARKKEGNVVRLLLIGVTLLFLFLFLVLPLFTVFYESLKRGLVIYLEALRDPETLSAIKLTLLTTGIVLPLNLAFGLSVAWAITRYRFPGKNLLVTLIDLPFAVSPVISGLIFVLLLGTHGLLGPLLAIWNIKIIYALPGIVLATLFVTFPYIPRELIPALQESGIEEEAAARTLGAKGWQIFFRITLPKIKWALLYALILCNARAIGEFGAVSVVSGHIRGETNTMPLHIEILYNEYQFSAAFAVSSLLTILAIVTLIAKSLIEKISAGERTHGN